MKLVITWHWIDIARSVFLEFKLTFASLFSKGISLVEEKFAPPFLDCKAELETSHQGKSLIGILVHFRYNLISVPTIYIVLLSLINSSPNIKM